MVLYAPWNPNHATHMRTHMHPPTCDDQINSAKKHTGVVPPRKFVNRLKKDNELFRSLQHQVAMHMRMAGGRGTMRMACELWHNAHGGGAAGGILPHNVTQIGPSS